MRETDVGGPASVGPVVFPDPLTSTHLVSAATFLYFDAPVKLPSPIWIPDEEAYGLHELVAKRNPKWAARFFKLDSLYGNQVDAWKRTREVLKPLADAFTGTLYAFDANSDALDEGIAFVEATGETMEEVGAKLDIGAAAGEVFHHLLIDKYFELDRDLDVLFEYCGEFLAEPSLVPLLVSCYLPRLMLTTRVARASDVLLFNNMQLIPLLEKLPVEVVEEPDATIDADTVAWEIFAQILAHQLDPLDAERTERLARVRMRHYDEVKSLKAKCLLLAEEMSPPDRLQDVIGAVDRFLRHDVNQEIAGLFELDRASVDDFVESVLTDEKSWLTTAASIASAFSGHPLFTAGAALATVSSVGAKAAKSAFDRHRKLRSSDYRVLYRIGRR